MSVIGLTDDLYINYRVEFPRDTKNALTQKRLAENGDDLYEIFSRLCKSGVVSSYHGIVYPVANVIMVGEFQIVNNKLEKLLSDGMLSVLATDAENDDVIDSFSRDRIEIITKTGWGNGSGRKRLDVLHSPRGNSFLDI
ncbi:hypothetical protein [Methylomonas sp. AM2-LC]|uniref:hypothetical protein n=1 Tax=Methylomonas sp. AM2-LC TaxID=3153301 RepID=UPI003267AA17